MKKKLFILMTCLMIVLPATFAQAQEMTTVTENNVSVSNVDNEVIAPRATTAKTNQSAPMFDAPNTSPFLVIPKGKTVDVIESIAGDTFAKVKYLGHTGLVYKAHLDFN